MFVDQVKIDVTAGQGGDGIVAYRRELKVERGGPFGGNGGKGGSIIFKGDEGLSTLIDLRYNRIIKAKPGEKGKNKGMFGLADDTQEISVDLPTEGNPTRPQSASTLNSHLIALASPGSPFSHQSGHLNVLLDKAILPRPPRPPLQATISWPLKVISPIIFPVLSSNIVVPTGTLIIVSSAFAPYIPLF